MPAEIAGAGDRGSRFSPMPGAPPPLERLAHELARGERERDVERRGTAPRRAARPRRRRASLQLVRDVVGLDVQRRDDAEHDGEDAADEDREEVVDARPAAAQPIEALHVKRERHEHGDERQHVEVLLNGG